MSLVRGTGLSKHPRSAGNGCRKRMMRSTASCAATRQVRKTTPAEVVQRLGCPSTLVCSRTLRDPTCVASSSAKQPTGLPIGKVRQNLGCHSGRRPESQTTQPHRSVAILCATSFCAPSPVKPPRRRRIVSVMPVSWPSVYARDSLGGTAWTKW